jgi:triosephosphate isomerase
MAGNWKMHMGIHASGGFSRTLVEMAKERNGLTCEVIVAPVATSLAVVHQAVWGSPINVAAQNCHWANQGAFTGEISAEMLKEIGLTHVILGHSERREYFGETDATVAQRTDAALAQGLIPIVCVGEVLAQRESGDTNTVLARQLAGTLEKVSAEQIGQLILAYEPVWAIGTGKVATSAQAQAAHSFIRAWLTERYGDASAPTRILYGGSAKPGNVDELLDCPDVDGCLIGGASLDEDSFFTMIDAADKRVSQRN